MSGVLYYQGDVLPKVHTRVIIIVDEVNHPTGIWDGVLMDTGRDYDPNDDVRAIQCTARINDTGAPVHYLGVEPQVNYRVYVATPGTSYLRERLAREQAEVRGLKRRLDTERGVYHALFKTLVDSTGFARLERLLSDFIAKLNELGR